MASAAIPVATTEPTPTPTVDNIAPLSTASTTYVSPWETLSAVNDNSNPSNSNNKFSGAYGNWYNPNSTQWVQYDWPQHYTLSSTDAYWFDDNAGAITPANAYFVYWSGSSWVNAGNLPLAKDAFNSLQLSDIVTNLVRVSILTCWNGVCMAPRAMLLTLSHHRRRPPPQITEPAQVPLPEHWELIRSCPASTPRIPPYW